MLNNVLKKENLVVEKLNKIILESKTPISDEDSQHEHPEVSNRTPRLLPVLK